MDINLRGVLHGVPAAYPITPIPGRGHIVNTSSLTEVGPAALFTHSALTKHAVVGLSTSLRIEAAARGIRVGAFCPAAIETPILYNGNPSDFEVKSETHAGASSLLWQGRLTRLRNTVRGYSSQWTPTRASLSFLRPPGSHGACEDGFRHWWNW